MKKVLFAVRFVCTVLFVVYVTAIMLVWNVISFIVSMLLGLMSLLFLADPVEQMHDLYETISQKLQYKDFEDLLKCTLRNEKEK